MGEWNKKQAFRFVSHHFFFNNTAALERFVPFNGNVDRQLCSTEEVRIVSAAAGFVHSVSIECDVDTMGATTFSAVADAEGDPTTEIGTASAVIDTAEKGFVSKFSENRFEEGDRVGMSIDPTGNMANVGGTLVLAYALDG